MNIRLIMIMLASLLLQACVTVGSTTDEEDTDAASFNSRLAYEYLQRGQRELAMDKIDKALEQNPDSAEAHLIKGMLLNQLQEYSDAEDHYEKAMSLVPDDANMQNSYASFLCERGDYRNGIQYFVKAGTNPRNNRPENAWTNAGNCAKRIPNLKQAEEFYRRALDINRSLPVALWQMADVSFQKNEFLAARGFMQRFEAVQRLPAEALWLGIRIERQLNDQAAERRYADILLRDFPESREAKLVLEGRSE